MCPSSTWFGRITIIAGLLFVLIGKTQLLNMIGYGLIALSFIYSAFFTDRSCSVDYSKKEGQEHPVSSPETESK